MTREEAIERLEYMANELNDKVFGATDCEALNIAIDELKHSETIDRVLEIIDEISDNQVIQFGCMAYGDGKEELMRRVLALKGGERV